MSKVTTIHPKIKNSETSVKVRNSLLRQRMFFFGIVLILLILATLLIWPFLSPILLALAMVVIMKPLYTKILSWPMIKGKTNLASGITVAIFCLIIAIPLLVAGLTAVKQSANLISYFISQTENGAQSGLNVTIESLWNNVSLEDRQQAVTAAREVAVSIGRWLTGLITSIGSGFFRFLTNAMIVIIVMFVLFPIYRNPDQKALMNLIPLPPAITSLYMDKANDMMVAMFKGIFVIAIVQGALMGLVLLIAGVEAWLFLGLLSMALAIMPVVGVSLVAWPVGILLILGGSVWQGLFVILMFLLVITNVDTYLRPKLVPKGISINPALVILSVFGGLQMMGIVGALYGPVIMILLVTSIEVYTKYILRSDLEILLSTTNDVDLKKLGLEFDRSTTSSEGGPLSMLGNLVGYLRWGDSQKNKNG